MAGAARRRPAAVAAVGRMSGTGVGLREPPSARPPAPRALVATRAAGGGQARPADTDPGPGRVRDLLHGALPRQPVRRPAVVAGAGGRRHHRRRAGRRAGAARPRAAGRHADRLSRRRLALRHPGVHPRLAVQLQDQSRAVGHHLERAAIAGHLRLQRHPGPERAGPPASGVPLPHGRRGLPDRRAGRRDRRLPATPGRRGTAAAHAAGRSGGRRRSRRGAAGVRGRLRRLHRPAPRLGAKKADELGQAAAGFGDVDQARHGLERAPHRGDRRGGSALHRAVHPALQRHRPPAPRRRRIGGRRPSSSRSSPSPSSCTAAWTSRCSPCTRTPPSTCA